MSSIAILTVGARLSHFTQGEMSRQFCCGR